MCKCDGCSNNVKVLVCWVFFQDIARYINSSKGDYENMRQIEEVEQSLVDYRGLPLLQCGRYILDGELRIRSSDQASVRPRSVGVALVLDLGQWEWH